MKRIVFVEGVPGAGKTTLVRSMLAREPGRFRLVYSADVVPENMVRRAVKSGRALTVEQARVIYRERPYEEYLRLHMQIWRAFCRRARDGERDILVDAGLIQAPLYELMGLYMLDREAILRHIQRTADIAAEAFEPELVYIRADQPALCVRQALRDQRRQREQWLSGFSRWLEVAPYPMERGYSGAEGIERFVQDRYAVDCFLLERLSIPKTIYRRESL